MTTAGILDGDLESAEVLRWQAFALRRPALPQDDGGLRGVAGLRRPHLEKREMWGTRPHLAPRCGPPCRRWFQYSAKQRQSPHPNVERHDVRMGHPPQKQHQSPTDLWVGFSSRQASRYFSYL